MRTRLMIASAATAALLAGAAFAQNAPAGDTAVNPPSASPSPQAGDSATPPATPAPAPSVAAPSSDAATVAPAAGAPTQRTSTASAGADVISNGPVPDTRENRAKYGQPLSRAGRMTKAAGN